MKKQQDIKESSSRKMTSVASPEREEVVESKGITLAIGFISGAMVGFEFDFEDRMFILDLFILRFLVMY